MRRDPRPHSPALSPPMRDPFALAVARVVLAACMLRRVLTMIVAGVASASTRDRDPPSP